MIALDWIKKDYNSVNTASDDSFKFLTIQKRTYKITPKLGYRGKAGIERINGLKGEFFNEDIETGLPGIDAELDYILSYGNEILNSYIQSFQTSPACHGIGDFLFQYMMETIFSAEKFLNENGESIKEIKISGCLSIYDDDDKKSNKNWRRSIPFYQHQAEKYHMSFNVSSNGHSNWNLEDFIKNCREDGKFEMSLIVDSNE